MRKLYKKIYNIFFPKRICGKTWIEESMTEKYGADWLDQVMDELRGGTTYKY